MSAGLGTRPRALLPHLGVFLFLALVVFSTLLHQPYYPFKAEDSVNITHVEFAGTSWRVMEVAIFNWLGFSLFGEWWQGLLLLSGLISVGLAFAAYLLWLELAWSLGDRAREAMAGGYAPGLLAAYLVTQLGHRFYADVTGVSYRLAGLFALLTLAAALRFLRTGQGRWWACAMLSYLLAGFSHSFSWLLGLVVLLLELAWRRRQPHGPVSRLLLRHGLLVLAPALVLLLTGQQLLANFLPSFAPMHGPVEAPATLLLGRYLYAMFIWFFIDHGLAHIPLTPGPAEWAVEVLLALSAAAGIWRLARGRGLDLFGLVVVLVLVWPALTMPSFWGANIQWVSGRHRFQYPALGLILMAGYLGALLLSVAGRLATRVWRGRRWMKIAAWGVVVLHLPFSPAASGLARAVTSGRMGLDHPCPDLAGCSALREPGDGDLKELRRDGKLRCLDLSRRDLHGKQLAGADLRRSNLSCARLTRAALDGARLGRSCGYFADLRRASLKQADLRGARFIGAFLNRADLTRADLSGASLRAAHLQDARLQGANLRGADLVWAALSRSDLRGADLSGANLTGGDLNSADLRGVNLSGATLLNVDVSNFRSEGANLQGALLCRRTLNDFNNRGGYIGEPRTIPCGHIPPERYQRPPWY